MFVALSIQHAMRMRRMTCRLWPVLLYSIFPHYRLNGMIFTKELLTIKYMPSFPLQFLSETFLQHAMRMRRMTCRLWPVLLYSIFPHYRLNGMIFTKELLTIKYMPSFPLQFLSETFLILRS